MYVDVPIFQRCCFCFPLRYGLIVYGYIKLIIMILLIIPAITAVVLFFTRGVRLNDFIAAIILTTFALMDISMSLLFLKAAHLKNFILFKIYYNYYYTFSIINIIVYLGFVALDIYLIGLYKIKDLDIWLEFTVYVAIIGFVNFVLLAYTLLLLRSQLLKLRYNSQFRFVNETTHENRCTSIMAVDEQLLNC